MPSNLWWMDLEFFTRLCKHLHAHISTMIFKMCTFALIPIGPMKASRWSFFMKPIKKYFSLKFYRMLPICGSLLNQGFIIIQSNQHNLICWIKLLQQKATDWCYQYPPYRWQSILLTIRTKCSWKNMAWRTCSNRVKICQCYAIPYPKIV